MARQDQFKEELFALFRKYRIEMESERKESWKAGDIPGISFFSYGQYDESTGLLTEETIDFVIPRWDDGNS